LPRYAVWSISAYLLTLMHYSACFYNGTCHALKDDMITKSTNVINPDVIDFFKDGVKIGAVTISDSSWWSRGNSGRRVYADSVEAAERQLRASNV